LWPSLDIVPAAKPAASFRHSTRHPLRGASREFSRQGPSVWRLSRVGRPSVRHRSGALGSSPLDPQPSPPPTIPPPMAPRLIHHAVIDSTNERALAAIASGEALHGDV